MDFSFLDEVMEEPAGIPITQGEGYRNILVVAETLGHSLLPATLEAMGQARELADQIGRAFEKVWAHKSELAKM